MAETPKWTPGPWVRREHRGELVGSNGSRVRIYDAGIALAMTPDDESRANARLIAAAPDLASAAKFLVSRFPRGISPASPTADEIHDMNRALEMFRAALAAATGEG